MVRLIAGRELRDLLRDRRTLFLILGLPVILYPVFILAAFAFALTMLEQRTLVGVAGGEYLPQPKAHPEAIVGGVLLLTEVDRRIDDPPLIVDGAFAPRFANTETEVGALDIKPLPSGDEASLQARYVDVLVIIPPDFRKRLALVDPPSITLLGREGDEMSKLAVKRVGGILRRWQDKFKDVRFARLGLPPHFDEPFQIHDPEEAKPLQAKTADELRDTLVKFLPFLLVMWTMAGRLYPAIDLTAGEKERGTMETLLISPAERAEIVAGASSWPSGVQRTGTAAELLCMAVRRARARRVHALPILSPMGCSGAWSCCCRCRRFSAPCALPSGAYARTVQGGAVLPDAAVPAHDAADVLEPGAGAEATV